MFFTEADSFAPVIDIVIDFFAPVMYSFGPMINSFGPVIDSFVTSLLISIFESQGTVQSY